MSPDQVKRFISLFEGLQDVYGYYNVEPGPAGEKLLGDRGTQRGAVTTDLWENHLNGETGLGICPINKENNCVWGCIDVDSYDVNHSSIINKIRQHNLPLIVCRSKSGGAHIFVFFKSKIKAKDLQNKLKELAAVLGFGGSEIFPKQTHILADKGDAGSWLNLPYFDAENTLRYGFGFKGQALELEQFLMLAEEMKQEPKAFLSIRTKTSEDSEFDGCPPCLEQLVTNGFPEGTRNNGMMAMAIFAKKKFPDDWKLMVETWNRKYFMPPLESDEVSTIIKSVERKDYKYRCNDLPLSSYCNRGKCVTREHGVGRNGAVPSFGALTKLDTDPPIWFLDVDGGGRLELETDELQNQVKFQRRCMEQLNIMPPRMGENDWQPVVQGLMESLVVLEAPNEASRTGYFDELLYNQYLSSDRVLARERDEILIGKPWIDPEKNEAYFNLGSLMEYLESRKFRELTRHQIASRLRKLGSENIVLTIKKRSVRLYKIKVEPEEPIQLDIPKMPTEVM